MPEIVDILTEYFSTHDYFMRSDFERFCFLTPSTAAKWIKILLNEGMIIKVGSSRAPLYKAAEGWFG